MRPSASPTDAAAGLPDTPPPPTDTAAALGSPPPTDTAAALGGPPPTDTAAALDGTPPAPTNARPTRNAKIAAVLVAVAVLVVAQRLGLFTRLGEPARLKQTLVDLGPWGYVAFLAAYTVLQPIGMPGTVFVMAAPLIWPWPVAFALSMAGTMSASVVGFSFARFVARDWVSKVVPARFRAYDEGLAKRGFVTVATLRFLFWMPQVLHTFLGLSKVPFWTHFWGSAAGYFIPLLVTSYFGERAFQAMLELPPSAWIGAAAAVITMAVVIWALRRRKAAQPLS